MRTHTQGFKDEVKQFGRELDSIITYTLNGETIELGNAQLNSVSLNYEGAILKSVMKELKIDSNVEIPEKTILNYQFGVKVNNGYEYLNYGNFVVYSVEKKEDTGSYEITCYDKMLYFMKDYEKLNITYPISVRDYIIALCEHVGLRLHNRNGTFANYIKRIPYELYLTADGESLGYTFRDVLDELAQVTASTICINENDRVEIRYISKGENIPFEILGSTTQNGTPTPNNPIDIVTKTGTITETVNNKQFTFDLGNIELCKIGNYQDKIYYNNNKWYLHKETNKINLKETTGWWASGTHTIKNSSANLGISDMKSNYENFYTLTYCNYFEPAIASQLYQGTVPVGYGLYSDKAFYISNNDWTLNEFNSFKENNDIVIYYLIENPTDTEITDSNLLKQLNKAMETFDLIDESYLKDINVNFGEKFGPVNSIVLSRSAGADNVYLKDKESIEQNGLCEIKIVDNQIMNFNNRADYLPDILDKLNGLEYYMNDFSSTGVAYLDLCDRYEIKIENNIYPCIMFNDEINVTQGLEENIHTNMPEQAETDYTKADKTDRKITQTYLIVDKQNQLIEATVQEVTEQNEKISTLEQTLDKFGSKIQDIADLTVSAETMMAVLNFEKINSSQPLNIVVKPTPVDHIAYKYPHNTQYPNSELFGSLRIIKIENLDTNEVWQYEIPDDLYYYDEDNYDSFVLDYENQKCYINKRCYMDNNGQVQLYSALHPDWELYPSNDLFPRDYTAIIDYEYPIIWLTNGDYRISLVGYDTGYLYARLMKQNKYTTQFATTAELNSAINQTAEEIKMEVSKKVDEEEVESYFDITYDSITAKTGKFAIDAENFKLDTDGTMTAVKGTISKFEFDDDKLTVELTLPYDYTNDDITRVQGIIAGTIQPEYTDYEKYDFIQNGEIDDVDLEIVEKLVDGTYSKTSTYTLDTTNPIKALSITNGSTNTNIGAYSSYIDTLISDYIKANTIEMTNPNNNDIINLMEYINSLEERIERLEGSGN